MREEEELQKSDNTSKSSPPFYMVEISTTKSTDPEKMKNLIFKKTGLLPSVQENGTHYVANMRLTLELLKVISESEGGIVKVSGDYTGGPEDEIEKILLGQGLFQYVVPMVGLIYGN